jgi:hypothetical protein
VRWYSYRWLIERYHYTLKSGCGLEKLQLETARRQENGFGHLFNCGVAIVVADL